jgi:putative ABC transport system permease protein
MISLAQDLKYALRTLGRSPGFTAVALATLALGIGANSAIFSVVDAVLLRPLPYPRPEALVFAQTVEKSSGQAWGTSPPDFYAIRSENRTFERLAAFFARPRNLSGDTNPERVRTLIVSADFFATLGQEPALGRSLMPADEAWGTHRVALLADGLWRSRFGADPAILGKEIRLDSESHAVVGVLPPGFSFAGIDAQLYVPMSFEPGDNLNTRNNYFLGMVGRLKPGRSPEQALADADTIMGRIGRKHPENKGLGAKVIPLHEALVGGARPALLVLMSAVGFVLLIACANVANLLLARGVGRRREMSIRSALGGSRGRLLRQLLTEGVLLGVLGGVAGILLASWSLEGLRRAGDSVLPRAAEIRLDPAVLGFTLIVSALAGVLFGLAPAFQATRRRGGDLNQGSRSTLAGGRRGVRAALVVSEVALSLVLLIGAGLLIESLRRLMAVSPGFDPRHTITAEINLPRRGYVDTAKEREFSPDAYVRMTQFFDTVVARVRQLPGVRAAGVTSGLPLGGENWGKNLTFYDRPLPANVRDLPPIQYRVVAGDYFRAAGIRLLRGRPFTDRDALDAPPVVIVNQELARRDFKGKDPIGRVVSVNPPRDLVPAGTLPPSYQGPLKATIVGVADDVHYGSLDRAPLPLVYAPFAQGSEGQTTMFLVVRSDGDALGLAPAIREQIRQVDAYQPVVNVSTMESRRGDAVAEPRLVAALLMAFALLALLLALIGIYGVLSYSVSQGTREIGIRLAMGALRRDVVRLVLGQALRLTGLGVGIGLAGALALTRLMSGLLFGVSATDPLVFGAIAALLAAVALFASFLPARRATRVDPAVVLRSE